ncbi:hypothetical protein J27TS7_43970 [Paenibacillus dendritiformis]|uniref:hypothetical protein n=1 Tax=Paenibacillus dendritiformis TaxID=130049 RepID=UPI001B1AF59F|nr:hypothetical protein [Paenibacillus dendritiformis]GIO74883.1 hypothetical protein J27TS7_43970 [Paenibacillus dendritiformis]
MRKLLLVVMICCLLVPVSYASAKTVSTDEKLLQMNVPIHIIGVMDDREKEVITQKYDESNGTLEFLGSSLLHDSSHSLLSDKFEKSTNVFGRKLTKEDLNKSYYKGVKYDSKKQYYSVLASGSARPAGVTSMALGVAYSDEWNIEWHDADANWETCNLILQCEMKYNTGNGNMVDATPKTGVVYQYNSFPSRTRYYQMLVEVVISRPEKNTGTTDLVSKLGVTSQSVSWSATISSSPGISLSPTTNTEQKAATGTIRY